MDRADPQTPETARLTRRRRPRLFDVAGLVAVLVFLAVLGRDLGALRFSGEEMPLAVQPEDIAAGFREGEAWHGLYLRGAKVGFSHLRMRRHGTGALMSSRTVLDLDVMRSRQRLDVQLEAKLDAALGLRSFEVTVASALADLDASGTVHDDRIDLEVRTAGVVQRTSLPIEHPPSFATGIHPALMRRHPEPGQRFELEYFDPMSLDTRTMEVEYVGTERITVLGQSQQAHHMVQEVAGQRLDVWVSALGEVLQEELPLGVTAIRESEAAATYGLGRGASLDTSELIENAAIVPTNLSPGFTEQELADLVLEGVSLDGLDLDGGRQSLEPIDETSARLLIVRDPGGPRLDMRDLADPAALPDEVTAALEPEMLIQSRAPEVVHLAGRIIEGRIIEGRASVQAAAEAIADWVYTSIDKQPVLGFPNALEVLATRAGDCNEHTALTVALMRAAGIPARTTAGVAYSGGKLYYHAWPEYWDGRWVAIDPTWGQHQADVGHVRLVVGGLQRQMEIMRLLGKLRIRGTGHDVARAGSPARAGSGPDPGPDRTEAP
jgi:hypothetical protein